MRADAVVLVVRAGVTRKRALISGADLLWRINAPVAGVVVNDVDLRLENFYTYRYGVLPRIIGTVIDRALRLPAEPTGMKKRRRENNMAKTLARAMTFWFLLSHKPWWRMAQQSSTSRPTTCRPEDWLRRPG